VENLKRLIIEDDGSTFTLHKIFVFVFEGYIRSCVNYVIWVSLSILFCPKILPCFLVNHVDTIECIFLLSLTLEKHKVWLNKLKIVKNKNKLHVEKFGFNKKNEVLIIWCYI